MVRIVLKAGELTGIRTIAGDRLPKLNPDARVEIRVASSDLEDDRERRVLLAERPVILFAKDETLRARMRPRKAVGKLASQLVRVDQNTTELGATFAEVTLKEPLKLLIRPAGISKLAPAECWIPALRESAQSLNEAYRKLSEVFERHRRSHSANVFEQVFYLDEGWWLPLEGYRAWVQLGQRPLRQVQAELDLE